MNTTTATREDIKTLSDLVAATEGPADCDYAAHASYDAIGARYRELLLTGRTDAATVREMACCREDHRWMDRHDR